MRNPGQAIISHPATAAASGFSVEVWSDRYLRDPSINAAQMMPSGEAIHGASALSVETASAYICKPELVIPARYGSGSDNRYLTDPRALYYTRLQMLQALAPHNVAAVVPGGAQAGSVKRSFLPKDFATGIVTGVTSMNASGTTLDTATNNGAINLFHEISDTHGLRWAMDGILLPFQRSVFQAIVCMGGSVPGDRITPSGAGRGSRSSVRYFKLPAGW